MYRVLWLGRDWLKSRGEVFCDDTSRLHWRLAFWRCSLRFNCSVGCFQLCNNRRTKPTYFLTFIWKKTIVNFLQRLPQSKRVALLSTCTSLNEVGKDALIYFLLSYTFVFICNLWMYELFICLFLYTMYKIFLCQICRNSGFVMVFLTVCSRRHL